MHSSLSLRFAALVTALGLAACGEATGTAPRADSPACTACHGDAARAGTALQQAAPPKDARGRTDRTELTVGAHQAHVYGGVACATCHQVPGAGDQTHFIAPFATVIFSGNVVGANGVTVAPWNRNLPTCANYCHGGRAGGSLPTPSWTQVTPLSCGSCHWDQQGALTSTGLHRFHVVDLPVASRLDCGACHGAGYSTGGVTGEAAATHVDGTLQILALVGWQDARCSGPRTCYSSCHTVQACRNWP
jgi:predicted CxxxxCH...CXXCH cytochrome family protein